eukprot:TRINITY_DN3165_c0_g1_i11.p1 TRINITY_DN3165_c0_g1~~TRINITY_DN3165_c0_g1_i11.p1  ORF type:complete len:343 (+),score=-1.20 TRINITY_DN3165_c0_g1_i11:197-1225(+)
MHFPQYPLSTNASPDIRNDLFASPQPKSSVWQSGLLQDENNEKDSFNPDLGCDINTEWRFFSPSPANFGNLKSPLAPSAPELSSPKKVMSKSDLKTSKLDQRKERKKKTNAAFARRMRAKQKIYAKQLNEEVEQLTNDYVIRIGILENATEMLRMNYNLVRAQANFTVGKRKAYFELEKSVDNQESEAILKNMCYEYMNKASMCGEARIEATDLLLDEAVDLILPVSLKFLRIFLEFCKLIEQNYYTRAKKAENHFRQIDTDLCGDLLNNQLASKFRKLVREIGLTAEYREKIRQAKYFLPGFQTELESQSLDFITEISIHLNHQHLKAIKKTLSREKRNFL